MEGNCRVAAAAALLGAEVHGKRHVAAEDHGVAIGAGELDEDVLAGDGVVAGWSNNSVGDAVEARYGNQLCLGVEGVGHMHMRHDFVGRLGGSVVFSSEPISMQPEVGFGIDEARIDSHAVCVDDFRAWMERTLCRLRRRR